MKMLLVIIVVVAAIVLVVLTKQPRVTPTYRVTIDEIPHVLAKLSVSAVSPTFAVFMFSTPDRPGHSNVLNIQFSIENGRPGFDWVLLAPRNIEDKDRYLEFARAAGFLPKVMEMNGVKYLRVEEGDIAQLCERVITSMYGRPKSEKIELIVEGFKWGS
jgi:hypothetical protein